MSVTALPGGSRSVGWSALGAAGGTRTPAPVPAAVPASSLAMLPSVPAGSPVSTLAAGSPAAGSAWEAASIEDAAVRALALRLGVSERSIRQQRRAGRSFTQIARAHGVSRAETVAIVARALSQLDTGRSGQSLSALALVIVMAGDEEERPRPAVPRPAVPPGPEQARRRWIVPGG